jgi:MFS family permease
MTAMMEPSRRQGKAAPRVPRYAHFPDVTTPPTLASSDAETTDHHVRAHLRHNVLALGLDFGLFLVGLSFAGQATILPAFATHLGAPNVVIGAIPAIMTVGWYLPPFFVAGHTESLSRKLPFIVCYTVWERVPYLVLAGVAFALAERAPGVSLAVFLVMLLLIAGTGGVLMPAWMDVVGRAVPTRLRGRFFAVTSMSAGVAGLGAGLVTAWLLSTVPAPRSYGICFLIAALFLGLSYVALATVSEPPGPAPAPVTRLADRLRRVPALLRGDRNLAWFLASRLLATVGGVAGGFYTVYALTVLGTPAWRAGVFTTAIIVGKLAGDAVLGWVADRVGHRAVLIVGIAATVVANAIALTARSADAFDLVFALVGVQFAAHNVSGLNVLLEFAPSVAERPTYVGLGLTTVAPLAFAAPLLAGLVADALGFRAVFLGAALGGLAALAVLIGVVRDPRHTGAARLAAPAPPEYT